ncbi:HTH domain-containing protein [Staphylococcus equorum]|nr:HTH domain-containing protein [Staphylococcus sp. OJ82]MDK9847427.1 HTH domain-containing protein [Staphylococcus equorum]MDK9850229.1 HTH domain-containing protein [Staphylococcus equorum]
MSLRVIKFLYAKNLTGEEIDTQTGVSRSTVYTSLYSLVIALNCQMFKKLKNVFFVDNIISTT